MVFDLGEPWNFDARGIWQLTEAPLSNLQDAWFRLVAVNCSKEFERFRLINQTRENRTLKNSRWKEASHLKP